MQKVHNDMGNTISKKDNLGNNIEEPNKDPAHTPMQLCVEKHCFSGLHQILIHNNVL